jgi:hypothetical protein
MAPAGSELLTTVVAEVVALDTVVADEVVATGIHSRR